MARKYITCCYKCEIRFPGCHSECPAYARQKEELDDTRKKVKERRYRSDAYVTGPKQYGPKRFEKL